MKAAAVLWLGLVLLPLRAQEPAFMEAGTHPGTGQNYSRVLWFDGQSLLKHAYGITARQAVLGEAAFDGDGIAAGGVRFRQRVWQRDTGPIDTWRVSFQMGADWRGGRDPGPRVGVVSTTIRGRHGFNAQADLNAGAPGAERLALNASHVYRIHPLRFRADTPGAWYTMLESLNHISPDGDVRGDIATGLLYEARRWAAEISLHWVDENILRLATGARILW